MGLWTKCERKDSGREKQEKRRCKRSQKGEKKHLAQRSQSINVRFTDSHNANKSKQNIKEQE
eukprot:5910857-Pleurochrysis_carterae.AAC.1